VVIGITVVSGNGIWTMHITRKVDYYSKREITNWIIWQDKQNVSWVWSLRHFMASLPMQTFAHFFDNALLFETWFL